MAEPPATVDDLVAIVRSVRAAGRSPVALSVVPLMHATGLFNSMGTLTAGGRVVLTRPGGLDPRHVWETVAAQRVRTLVVAGNAVCQPLVDELLAAEAAGRPHDLSSLESVTSSGTVLSDRVKRALHERADGHDHRRDRVERGRPVRRTRSPRRSPTCRPGSTRWRRRGC